MAMSLFASLCVVTPLDSGMLLGSTGCQNDHPVIIGNYDSYCFLS